MQVLGIAAALMLGLSPALANSGEPADGWIPETSTTDDSVSVEATAPATGDSGADGSGEGVDPSDVRYFRADADLCLLDDLESTLLSTSCDDGHELAYTGPDCPDDTHALDPLFRTTVLEDGTITEPVNVDDGLCVTTADLTAAARRAWRTMPVHPARITLEADRDWAIVNLGLHPRTTDSPQTLDTTLLSVPVQLQALPRQFTWDPGDDSPPITTTHPGDHYDTSDAIHLPYPAPGTFTLTLTTTWHGRFRITGTPTWTPIDGVLTTTDSTDPIEVHDAPVRLTD